MQACKHYKQWQVEYYYYGECTECDKEKNREAKISGEKTWND